MCTLKVKICVVKDLQNLGMSHLNREGLAMLKANTKMVQDNYPEMAGRIIIANAPWVFGLVWKIVKPWLPPRTLEKVSP
jgi:hypothetical protein